MTVTAITPALKVSMLKHLVAGRDLDFVATVTKLSRQHVLDVVAAHGYPEKDKMDWAIDMIIAGDSKVSERPLVDVRKATPLANPITHRVPSPPAQAGFAVIAASTVQPVSPTYSALEQAAKSTFARTRTLGAKIANLLDDLEERLQDERAAVAARVKADKVAAQVKTRIAELEAEIAKLKGKPATKKSTSTKAAAAGPTEASVIRAWAAANGVPCTRVGIVPTVVRDAWVASTAA
jgi:hypothetical protein